MVHLILGNTGAGKTTYAQQLKKKNKGVVFSIDSWNRKLFFPDKTGQEDLTWFLERIERSEEVILDLILQLDASGVDAILDLGLATCEHRNKFWEFARRNDLQLQIHYLNIPSDVRLNRVEKRNKEKGKSFEFNVSESDFNFMENHFEPPTASELKSAIIINLNNESNA